MRGNGRVYRPTWTVDGTPRTAKTWWLDYQVHGERHREPAHTTSQREALRMLHQRVGDRRAGRLVARDPDGVTVHELRVLHEKQYELDARRSKARIVQCWGHVEAFFGAATRTVAVTTTRLDDYAAARLTAGAARATVNRELSALRTGFKLAVAKGLLAVVPVFQLPKERNARSGFFEEGDFAAVLCEVPESLRPLLRFLRLTGWRVSEATGLTWDQVDRAGEVLVLAASTTKGGDARTFPYGQAPELRELLEAQYAARTGLFVFPGQRGDGLATEGSFYKAWHRACQRAGVPGKLVHDLRRSAARDMRRAGISEGEIMKLCGWRTRAMFDRYNIIDEQDLAAAVARRFASGQVAAKSGGAGAPVGPLGSSAATVERWPSG